MIMGCFANEPVQPIELIMLDLLVRQIGDHSELLLPPSVEAKMPPDKVEPAESMLTTVEHRVRHSR